MNGYESFKIKKLWSIKISNLTSIIIILKIHIKIYNKQICFLLMDMNSNNLKLY